MRENFEMKIAFFFTVNKGLLSKYFESLATYMAEKGHEVVLFSFKGSAAVKIKNDVRYVSVEKGNYLKNYSNIYRFLKQEQPSVIITNFNYLNPSILFAKLLGVGKIIAWQHTSTKHNKSSKRQIAIKRWFLKKADTVVVNSKLLGDEMAEVFRIPPNRITRLPFFTPIAGCEPQKIDDLAEDAFYIGCPGRLLKDKNQRTLLEAFAEVKKNNPTTHIKLVFAGTGPDTEYLKQRAAALQLSDLVLFLGMLSAEEMAFFYKRIDLAVFPSKHEAFGLVLIEAMALETPFLVSNVFGALQFLPEEFVTNSELIFNPENGNELAVKIEKHVKGHHVDLISVRNMYDKTFSKVAILKAFESIVNR